METVSREQVVGGELGLSPRVAEALGELVSSAKEGLLALRVGVGLGVLAELMEEEVVRHEALFVDPTNRNRVAVLIGVPDINAVMAAMETPGAEEAMAYDGVLPETLVILVEE